MNKTQALELLYQASRKLSLEADMHGQLQQAYLILKMEIAPKPEAQVATPEPNT